MENFSLLDQAHFVWHKWIEVKWVKYKVKKWRHL